MEGIDQYTKVSLEVSKLITCRYSTSFSLGIRMLNRTHREAVYAIYGFVRLGDEIVDSFHTLDKSASLASFRLEVFESIRNGISLNPVLHAFQHVVNRYGIEHWLIEQFLDSMAMDLDQKTYSQSGFETYILGSAEVVGLMCLHIFLDNHTEYERLKPYAMKLGSAFQKINFLRDLGADVNQLGRQYFPDFSPERFTDAVKKTYEADMLRDFQAGYEGLRQLPLAAARGVWLAYLYYFSLFKRIVRTPATELMQQRLRVPNRAKYLILIKVLIISPFVFKH